MATHHFEVSEATKYGIESAILLSNIRFWLAKNKANKVHSHDGFYWTYNSSTAFSELFPYMNRRTISRRLKELCDLGVLVDANYNKAAFDKTPWYTIPSEFAISDKTHSSLDKSTTGQSVPSTGQSVPSTGQSVPSTGQSVPTIPDSKTQIVNTDLKATATAAHENEKPVVVAKSKNETSLPDYQKQSSDEINQGQDWLNRFVNAEPFTPLTNPNDIVLTPEQLACFQWAMQDLTFWRGKINSKAKFISLYEKQDSALKHQYETELLKQQAIKSPDSAENTSRGSNIVNFKGQNNYDTRNQNQQPARYASLADEQAAGLARYEARIERERLENELQNSAIEC